MKRIEKIDGPEMARRIKRMRTKQRYSLAAVGRWFEVPRQTIHEAENPDRGGAKIDELRTRIYNKLSSGATVEGPVFVIESDPEDPGLFDAEEEEEEPALHA